MNQKGITPIAIVIALLVALGLGVFLVQQKTNLKPQADNPRERVPTTSFTLSPLAIFINPGGQPLPPEAAFPKSTINSASTPSGEPDNQPIEGGGEGRVNPGGKVRADYLVDDKISVQLSLRSDIDAANLFNAQIKFPSELLEVEKISTLPNEGSPIIKKIEDNRGRLANGSSGDNNQLCAQVITRACTPEPPEGSKRPVKCQDFPTPCDVPPNWITLPPSGQKPTVCSSDSDCQTGFYCRLDSKGRSEIQTNICLPNPQPSLEPTGGSNNFIKFWIERKFDNKEGKISIVGGVPDPGFKTDVKNPDSIMATIIFKAKKAGTGTLSFDDSSAIYRNSDNTNILVTKNPVDITIKDLKPELPPTDPQACPADIEVCPDGSTVSRIPPSCNFASCSKTNPSPAPSSKIGDLNSDGKVNFEDIKLFISYWSKNDLKGDVNRDGKLTISDFSALLSNFGK